ncbi:MAG TPA: esterase family protein [Firmicutes bacterium]|nr:esterase family protein [Bacillota bacterium]
MAVFEGTIYADSLKMMTSLTVTLPCGKSDGPDGEMPVLYLLHGLSDNHSAWLRRSRVDYYAEQAGFAVVMPEVQRGFYCDMAYGPDYYTYIAEELPALCRQMFRFSAKREDNFIAGLSMGGYGALKTAFRLPEAFAGAASFSGAVDVRSRLEEGSLEQREVTAISGGQLEPENDLFFLAERLAKQGGCPPLYITCGQSDFMYEDHQRFRRHLESLGVAHTYEEWPGGHDWDFWDESIRRAFEFFTVCRSAAVQAREG